MPSFPSPNPTQPRRTLSISQTFTFHPHPNKTFEHHFILSRLSCTPSTSSQHSCTLPFHIPDSHFLPAISRPTQATYFIPALDAQPTPIRAAVKTIADGFIRMLDGEAFWDRAPSRDNGGRFVSVSVRAGWDTELIVEREGVDVSTHPNPDGTATAVTRVDLSGAARGLPARVGVQLEFEGGRAPGALEVVTLSFETGREVVDPVQGACVRSGMCVTRSVVGLDGERVRGNV
ncbi:hypothetical protein M501DRAFT_1061628 [Patellaria atrata CBS 101060]|uniref:Uncharacterized protein n=1 Tax=Patellaria atrata CBS 101060 TaxID=1346257 RepID=A0A9P4VNK0_9PEZI|nr:hypothetical protein M501DRAFT_1061628 [Patellaria atrata CBS 101060]